LREWSTYGPGDRRNGTGCVENKKRCYKLMVEEPYAPNKREPAANAHNVGKKGNNAVLELDVLKVKLLNSIEQLSIAVIKN
jgi:hypothetical protein